MSKPLCDFCSDPKPVWSLGCPSFELTSHQTLSQGDWLACETCKELILAGKWRELAELSAEKTENGRMMIAVIGKTRTVSEVMQLHASFRERFTGNVKRIG